MSNKNKKILNLLIYTFFLPFIGYAQTIVLKNNLVSRTLQYNGKVWLTTQFARADGKDALQVKSDELHLLFMDNGSLSLNDFIAAGKPELRQSGDTTVLTIFYRKQAGRNYPDNTPQEIGIKYTIRKGEPYIRKAITLSFDKEATIDRLEVERFITAVTAKGGGRGEPVFLNSKWFAGLEYPAGYSRHTDGNTPKADSRHFEKVGNYSYIDLEGRDMEPKGKPGMVRLMHFPGYAKQNAKNTFKIVSKTAVAGIGSTRQTAETAFMDYLATIYKAPRSFLHFNNWFEPKAKDLSGDALVNIFRDFKKAISPYGIKMDAMVADDGWQDKKSIWQPSPKYFPNGIADVRKLSDQLNEAGTGFGLWLSIGGTNAGVDWGETQGYLPAKPNQYFSRYSKYYTLSHPKYKNEILAQVPRLAREANLKYYKHDFNQLSDLSEGAGHPPTDRHGHEANLDVLLDVLTATRKVRPDIFQNVTNWVWFSPWWLQYADALWMLAGDDGLNGNWPEISSRAMGTTDRDTYIWRMWGEPADRPLVPISRLMTHGIIRNSTGRMESKEDTMQDWMEHVLMHYGRGTLLKEWYISPSVMSADHWKALCTVHNWTNKNRESFNHTQFVGGRPDEGHAYGYIGWNGNKGVLVVRNPQVNPQKLIIPFNQTVLFNGPAGKQYHANVVFPYQDACPEKFTSGKNMEITIPGYATMAFELAEGNANVTVAVPAPPKFVTNNHNTSIEIPADAASRCDLLVIGYPDMPVIKINGQTLTASRKSKAAINKFAGYAISGMPSKTARNWTMASYDLKPYAGKAVTITYEYNGNLSAEAHLLMEREVVAPATNEGNDVPWAITQTSRRQTISLWKSL